ncbi:MAG: class I SAM-dependent methyltransferase [Candidatus Binataceae bacterium]
MPQVRPIHYLLGVEGLAILRSRQTSLTEADDRVQELRRLLLDLEATGFADEVTRTELDVQRGYERWAPGYDRFESNALIGLEQPFVCSLIDALPQGRALDAACGTGRLAGYMSARGHSVIGIDSSSAMLAAARRKFPSAALMRGDLLSLPFERGSFDLVVCTLALEHLPRLAPAILEIARVARDGGHVILSGIHPTSSILGSRPMFKLQDGTSAVVESYFHPHAEYLRSFREAGLTILDCLEPVWSEQEVEILGQTTFALAPEAFQRGLIGLPGALVWSLIRS